MKKTKYAIALALFTTITLVGALGATAHAETDGPQPQGASSAVLSMGMKEKMHGGFMHQGIRGTVTAISGSTLTVTSTNPKTSVATVYTVDATNAKAIKAGAASTVGAISVGDTVMINGTVTGTSVVATTIFDGKIMGMGMMKKQDDNKTEMPMITGNGQPIVGGSVTAINGSSITITNKSNVTYTIDAGSATITKRGIASATIANISVGDTLLIQGTINGTAVTASSVMDQASPAPVSESAASANAAKPHNGFFGAIGGFFSHLFGF